MNRIILLVTACVLQILTATLSGQVPTLINYQGRVAVGSVNFEGAGLFKFALVNSDGTVTFWSNDGTSDAGSEPVDAVTLTVEKGLYSVLLGDVVLGNMSAIPPGAFANADVRLRVWFDDGVNGFQLLAPDQRLAPSSYLADGSVTSTTIGDAAITPGKIAPGAIMGGDIAPNSLDFSLLTVPVAPDVGQVLSFDGTGLSWASPVGAFAINGTSAYYNGGNVGIGTNNPQSKLEVNTISGSYGFTHTAGASSLGSYVGGSTSGASGGWLGTISDDPLHFFVHGGQPAMTVTKTGNVGIGTTIPAAKLEVRTAPNSYGLFHSDGTVKLATFLGGGAGGGWLGTYSNDNLHFFVGGGGPSMTIGTTGNVGIGTIPNSFSPKLDVLTTASGGPFAFPAISGRHPSNGIGVSGSSISGPGVLGNSTSGSGVYASSSSGEGLFATSASGPAIYAAGNVRQDLSSGGFVKAMVFVKGDTAGIVRCFNSFLNQSGANAVPCGFTTRRSGSSYEVKFGFFVDNRFVNVFTSSSQVVGMFYGRTLENTSDGTSLVIVTNSVTDLTVFVY